VRSPSASFPPGSPRTQDPGSFRAGGVGYVGRNPKEMGPSQEGKGRRLTCIRVHPQFLPRPDGEWMQLVLNCSDQGRVLPPIQNGAEVLYSATPPYNPGRKPGKCRGKPGL